MTRLGDLCEFRYGKSLPEGVRRSGTVPVYGSNGVVGTHDEAITDGRAIVVGRKGSVGAIHLSDSACWPIDTTYFIDRAATDVDLSWLGRALSTLRLPDLNKAAAVPGLTRSDVYELRLFVPQTAEQRRIAAIVDQADDLRRKRRVALERLEQLIRSDFETKFVDAEVDSWKELSIAEFTLSIRTGPFGSQLLHSEFTDEGVAVLGIDNAVTNAFSWNERRFVSQEKYQHLRRYRVYPRDVLVTIMGTCGHAAIVPDDIPLAINTKHLCCLTLDQKRCAPEFLHAALLMHPSVLHQLGVKERGAVMPGLNMGLIKETRLKLPPIKIQRAFAAHVSEIDKLKASHRAHLAKLDALFASLQHRAFRGEL